MRFVIQPGFPTQQFLSGIARCLVEVQCALDKHGHESVLSRDQEGVSPNAFIWSQYQLVFPFAFQCRKNDQASAKVHLMLAPRVASKGSLKLVFRYSPRSQGEGMPV